MGSPQQETASPRWRAEIISPHLACSVQFLPKNIFDLGFEHEFYVGRTFTIAGSLGALYESPHQLIRPRFAVCFQLFERFLRYAHSAAGCGGGHDCTAASSVAAMRESRSRAGTLTLSLWLSSRTASS